MPKRNEFDHIVVEKGEYDFPTIANGLDSSKYGHIEYIKKGDSSVLPNIDSCLGVVIKLKNDDYVVAHLGMYDTGNGSTIDVVNEQLEAITSIIPSGNGPKEIVLIGDKNEWDKSITALKGTYMGTAMNMSLYREGSDPGDVQIDGSGSIKFVKKDDVAKIESIIDDSIFNLSSSVK